MTLDQIQQKAETFFEFPTANKDHVTTTSAVLFARECVSESEKTAAEYKKWAEHWEAETHKKNTEIFNLAHEIQQLQCRIITLEEANKEQP